MQVQGTVMIYFFFIIIIFKYLNDQDDIYQNIVLEYNQNKNAKYGS